MKVGEAMYKAQAAGEQPDTAQGQSGGSGTGPTGTGPNGERVVDADFEEVDPTKKAS